VKQFRIAGVQACEPIYRAAEDAVKILAKEYAPEVYDITWGLKHVKKLIKTHQLK